MNDISVFIGEKIKLARVEKGISQQELADAIGLSRMSIINIENGRHSPTNDGLYNIASMLGKSVGEFFPPIKTPRRKLVTVEKFVKVKRKVKEYRYRLP